MDNGKADRSMTQAKQNSKKIKIPGCFKKAMPEKKFKKKILSRLYIQEYKDFILAAFQKDEQGNYRLKQEFTKPELKKLKTIAKSIQKNRGMIQPGKVILVAVLLAGIIGFNLIFKDALVETAAENGLQDIFAARVEFTGLKFQPEKGRLFFSALAVADKAQPFKNLFEMGTSEIYLDMAQLLKGKVVINNIECQALRWQTARKTSGTLPRAGGAGGAQAAESAEQQPENVPVSALQEETAPLFSFDLKAIDVNAILETQRENLLTLKELEKANSTITGLQAKWNGIINVYTGELETMAGTVRSFTTMRVQSIKTPEEALRIYKQVESAITDVKSLSANVSSTREDFLRDLTSVKGLMNTILSAIQTDYAALKALIELPNPEKQSILASLAAGYLEEKMGPLYGYCEKALEYVKAVRSEASEPAAEPAGSPVKGADVYFPAREYPKFLLKQAAFSTGDKQANEYFELNIKNVSSMPELTLTPLTFIIKNITDGRELSLEGLIDIRQAADETLQLKLQAVNFPLEIDGKLAVLGINHFKSMFDFRTMFSRDRNGQIRGEVELDLNQLRLELAEAENLITRELGKIFTSITEINMTADYSLNAEKQFEILVNTNVDELIKDRIGGLIEDTLKSAEAKIETAFDDFIEESLQSNRLLSKVFTDLQTALDGNLTDLSSYQKLLENKKKELADFQKNLTAELERRAREELDKQAEKAKAEAEKMKADAAGRVNTEVEKVTNKLPKFSF